MNTLTVTIEEAKALQDWYKDMPFEILKTFKNNKSERLFLIKSESSIEVIVIYEDGMHLVEDMRFVVPENQSACDVVYSFATQLFNTLIKRTN